MTKFFKKIFSIHSKESSKSSKKTVYRSAVSGRFPSIKDPKRREVAEKIDRDFGRAIERLAER